MTNNDVSQDQALKDALDRYGQRFEPEQREWSRIVARRQAQAPARTKPKLRRWPKLPTLTLAAAVGAVAVIAVVSIAVLPVNIELGQTRAQATGVPPEPAYTPVGPAPAFPAGTTMAAIAARGAIRVGVKADQPGFGLHDPKTGTWSGFDVEMAKLMAVGIFGGDVAHLGNKIIFVPVISKNREAVIQAGTVDMVIATYTINDARKHVVSFAGPYFRARQDIMVNSTDNTIHGVGDLDGKDVCTVRGTTSLSQLVANAPQAKLTLEDTFSACATDLKNKRVAALSTDNVILAGLVHQNGTAFKLVNNPFSDELYGIGVNKGDEAFVTFLNNRLTEIDRGDWAAAQSYALQNIQTSTPPPIGQ